jgi:BlaI family penicillinase repressor
MSGAKHSEIGLSRREHQMMDILFSLGRASGQEIRERLPDRPSYSAVRTILRVLENKGHIRHVEEGLRFVYLPLLARETARKSEIQRLISTFFDGSAKAAAAAFLDPTSSQLSGEDLKELEGIIRRARKERQ